MNYLFQLEKVSCAYGSKGPVVLFIDELKIEQGKLVFLLGASGCGKSTLLETLGLMNNTVRSGELIFSPTLNQQFLYSSLWENDDKITIANLRRNHFNFIFQNTNLMENFTAYENVCLSEMIKKSKNLDQVLEGVNSLMNRVGLPESEVDMQTLAMNLSGGQRQRLAFVRALNSSSKVLLCDEPTGNLDEANANELFEVIRENLKNDLTAIVVSHDINLAVKHADVIVLITKDVEKGFGEILQDKIFPRISWESLPETELEVFKNKIRSTFSTRGEHIIEKDSILKKEVKSGRNFREIFFSREATALAGKHNINFMLLCLIFLFSFIAIGFGNGSLNYLDSKLNSAFVNWLTITIPYLRSNSEGSLKEIIAQMNDPEIRAHYDFDSVTTYTLASIYLVGDDEVDSSFVRGRTFDVIRDRKFIQEELLSDANRIQGASFKGKQDLAIIVTAQLLERFGYAPASDHILIAFPISDKDSSEHGYRHMPVPIRAIVDELPGKSSFGCTEYFYKAYLTGPESPFNPATQIGGIDYFIQTSDSAIAIKVHHAINRALKNEKAIGDYSPVEDPELPEINTESIGIGYNLQVRFWSEISSYKTLDTISNLILNSKELIDYKGIVQRTFFYGYVKDVSKQVLYSDMLSVYFNSLDSVKSFSNYVGKTFNSAAQIEQNNVIEVDASRVKDKENFNFLSSTALIISYLIIIFGSISVSLFIFNLLKMHLNKVKMNIGTFMAIGLGNNESRNIYFIIIVLFIFIGIIVSSAFAWVLGYIINYYLSGYLALEEGVNYFNMLSWNTVIAITFFVCSSMFVSWITINRMLSKSPGDLIYNR